MTTSKLKQVPFVNDIKQTLNVGDKCILVGTRRGAWVGTYAGLVGQGARITFDSTRGVYRHVTTGKKYSESKALKAMGEKKIRYSWRDRSVYEAFNEQCRRITRFREDNYKLVDEPCIRSRWSYRRRLYKLGELS